MRVTGMHVILAAEDSEAELRSELRTSFREVPARSQQPGVIEAGFDLVPGERLPYLAFARQLLPNAKPLTAESIKAWAQAVFDAILQCLPNGQPWALHVAPCYGRHGIHRIGARAWHSLRLRGEEVGRKSRVQRSTLGAERPGQSEPPSVGADAGRHRCRLIRETALELLRQKRRQLLRNLREDSTSFAGDGSLVQLLLTTPTSGFLSVAVAPTPFEQRHLIAPFPRGDVPIPTDKTAPSRAFAKLVEAEVRLGRAIRAGETCVDLGAAPGSWTYVAANRQARVIAVDRSPLREDLMSNPLVQFVPEDAFRFAPRQAADWLLCDLIAPADRVGELLLRWLRNKWCRHFVITLKLKDLSNPNPTPAGDCRSQGAPALAILENLKHALPPLTADLYLTRLSANKKEVCAFGAAAG